LQSFSSSFSPARLPGCEDIYRRGVKGKEKTLIQFLALYPFPFSLISEIGLYLNQLQTVIFSVSIQITKQEVFKNII